LEYFISILVGGLIIVLFFIAPSILSILLKSDTLSLLFLPILCLIPLVAGAVSALVFEKIRKFIFFKEAAIVGALSGLSGSVFSAFILLLFYLLLKIAPFGSFLGGILFFVFLFAIVGISTILGALGAVLIIKFLKDTEKAG